jgi:hypothetical protein
MLIKVALEQANIHTMSISWISLLLSILFCVDILRRTKRASYPECGRLRFTVGLGVILAVFVSFGASYAYTGDRPPRVRLEWERAGTRFLPTICN